MSPRSQQRPASSSLGMLAMAAELSPPSMPEFTDGRPPAPWVVRGGFPPLSMPQLQAAAMCSMFAAISDATRRGLTIPPPVGLCGACARPLSAKGLTSSLGSQQAHRHLCFACQTFFFEMVKKFQSKHLGSGPLQISNSDPFVAFAHFRSHLLAELPAMKVEPDRLVKFLGYLAWALQKTGMIKYPRPGAKSQAENKESSDCRQPTPLSERNVDHTELRPHGAGSEEPAAIRLCRESLSEPAESQPSPKQATPPPLVYAPVPIYVGNSPMSLAHGVIYPSMS